MLRQGGSWGPTEDSGRVHPPHRHNRKPAAEAGGSTRRAANGGIIMKTVTLTSAANLELAAAEHALADANRAYQSVWAWYEFGCGVDHETFEAEGRVRRVRSRKGREA